MKVIQSYWSKPSEKRSEDPNSRFQGGWLHQKYAFYSQALSCLTFKEFYNDVEMYTDKKGKILFSDILEIPYSSIHITLDHLNNYDPKLWALGKIVTYAEQTTPFIHADSDVFIWKRFPEKLISSPLFVQNLEVNFPAYEEAFNDILKNFDWIPTEMINALYKHEKICAFNAGIIGGNNLNFFKILKDRALKIIHKNHHLLNKIDIGIFNTIFEQQLGFAIAEKNNIPIKSYLNDVDSDFSNVIDFHNVPFRSKYVHCIGYAKKSVFACEQVEARLRYQFPEFYKHLNRKLNSHFTENYLTSDFSDRRFNFLFDMYNWLADKSAEDIFDTSFKISPECKFTEENDSYFITYPVPQDRTVKKEILKDWNLILLYFEEATSIRNLYTALCEDGSFLQQTNKEELKNKLISFVMDKTLLLEILTIH